MRMPQPGERVLLLCRKCRHTFTGACPDNLGLGFVSIAKKAREKTRCPRCGSKRLMLSPWVQY